MNTLYMGCTTLQIGFTTLYTNCTRLGCTTLHMGYKKNYIWAAQHWIHEYMNTWIRTPWAGPLSWVSRVHEAPGPSCGPHHCSPTKSAYFLQGCCNLRNSLSPWSCLTDCHFVRLLTQPFGTWIYAFPGGCLSLFSQTTLRAAAAVYFTSVDLCSIVQLGPSQFYQMITCFLHTPSPLAFTNMLQRAVVLCAVQKFGFFSFSPKTRLLARI